MPQLGDEFVRAGKRHLQDGNYSRALSMFEEASVLQPHNAELYLQMSVIRTLIEPADVERALRDVNSAIQKQPSLGQAWKQKGDLHRRLNDFESATDAYTQAVHCLQDYEKLAAQQALGEVRVRAGGPTPNTFELSARPGQTGRAPSELPPASPISHVTSAATSPPAATATLSPPAPTNVSRSKLVSMT